MGKIVFISPHLDDVVLSCGEYVAKLRRVGKDILVITAFSGAPIPDCISETAKLFHSSCNLGDDAIQHRKREDERAMQLLEVDYVHLDELECLYRINADGSYKYDEISQIYTGAISGEEDFIGYLANKFESVVAQMDVDEIFIPLGIGHHIDHVICRKASEILASRFLFKIYYYQDTPYVCNVDNNRCLEYTSGLNSFWIKIYDEEWNLKMRAIDCYESQLNMLWKSEEERLIQLNSLSYKYSTVSRSIDFYTSEIV